MARSGSHGTQRSALPRSRAAWPAHEALSWTGEPSFQVRGRIRVIIFVCILIHCITPIHVTVMLLRRVYACPSASVPSVLCSISTSLRFKWSPKLQSTAAPFAKPSRIPRSQLCVSRRTASLGFATAATAAAMTDHSLLTVHRIPCLSVCPRPPVFHTFPAKGRGASIHVSHTISANRRGAPVL